MRIDRILNNNVVIIKDENGEEQVVCGKGIAYKKKAGDLLSEKLINKVFVLKDTAQKQHFQEIISEIPVEYIQITTEIVEMLTQTLERKLNEAIYISIKRPYLYGNHQISGRCCGEEFHAVGYQAFL